MSQILINADNYNHEFISDTEEKIMGGVLMHKKKTLLILIPLSMHLKMLALVKSLLQNYLLQLKNYILWMH